MELHGAKGGDAPAEENRFSDWGFSEKLKRGQKRIYLRFPFNLLTFRNLFFQCWFKNPLGGSWVGFGF